MYSVRKVFNFFLIKILTHTKLNIFYLYKHFYHETHQIYEKNTYFCDCFVVPVMVVWFLYSSYRVPINDARSVPNLPGAIRSSMQASGP